MNKMRLIIDKIGVEFLFNFMLELVFEIDDWQFLSFVIQDGGFNPVVWSDLAHVVEILSFII